MTKDLLKNKVKQLPDKPGVYIFRAANGMPLYIGKAGSLRKRVASYFSKTRVSQRISLMVQQAKDVDSIQLKSEAEALILEDRLIKEYQPHYNVSLKDDKRYPSLRIQLLEPWPRIQLIRLRKEDGARYYGPYTDSGSLRRVLKFIWKTFKLRRCKPRTPRPDDIKHCLYYHLGECLAPCIRNVSPIEYQEVINQVCLLLEGRTKELFQKLRVRMQYASRHMNYEKAAKFRDIIKDLEKVVGTKVRKDILGGRVYKREETKKGLEVLRKTLKLSGELKWIEAFDVSNILGRQGTGSLIVFRNGLSYPAGYKRFRIKTMTTPDDYAMMQEIVARRYKRVLAEGKVLPDLVLIDGGKGQLAAAKQILTDLGLKAIPVIGLAKRFEEVYIPGRKQPIVFPGDSPALRLLIQIRDEAHRFAIAYHRSLRRKRVAESILDEVSGIGPVKKRKLLKHFGSIKNIAQAEKENICKIAGIANKVAEEIKLKLDSLKIK